MKYISIVSVQTYFSLLVSILNTSLFKFSWIWVESRWSLCRLHMDSNLMIQKYTDLVVFQVEYVGECKVHSPTYQIGFSTSPYFFTLFPSLTPQSSSHHLITNWWQKTLCLHSPEHQPTLAPMPTPLPMPTLSQVMALCAPVPKLGTNLSPLLLLPMEMLSLPHFPHQNTMLTSFTEKPMQLLLPPSSPSIAIPTTLYLTT